MVELRHNTEQRIVVGTVRRKTNGNPITGALLSWYYWTYLILPFGTVVELKGHGWSDVPNCNGLYYLTLTESDTIDLGCLTVFINDSTKLKDPVVVDCMVVGKNVYDSKYGNKLLDVNPNADKF